MEIKDEAVRLELWRRCAKAAILIYSLKSSPNRHFNSSIDRENEVEKDLLVKEIRDLKMKLAIERIKKNRIKLCSLTEVMIQMTILLSFCTLFLVLVFQS
ncbi:uncharacterized protein LOC126657014 [Mercurialis annua]|uniref:uncharacterized protein LOC126657014 n=1 Tax=Mercurialis annua TaxID=3986 RepID=UPI00215FC339|nr:uncharacterized protein LOC126657014 [Mercurialis annua]